MAAPNDLVSLQDVKAFLGVQSGNDDALLTGMIAGVSQAIRNYLNRPFFLPKVVTENYDGIGGDALLLRNWPVTSVQSVSVNGQIVPPAPTPGPNVAPGAGWQLEDDGGIPPGAMQRIFLTGYSFAKGRRNVTVTYRAGYQLIGEHATIPAGGGQIAPEQPHGAWASDQGVAFADGTVLTAVSGAPNAGQYSVNAAIIRYTFAAADAGKAVLLSYGYIPSALADAAKEWIADRYRHKDRIAQVSKSLGGQETTAFRITDMPGYVKLLLVNFNCILSV